MSALRSIFWRLALLPIMLTATLLLPTLHVHSAHGHDEDGARHPHTVIHADFFSTSVRESGHLDHEELAASDHHFANLSQSNLAALTAHVDESQSAKLTEAPRFFAVALDESFLRRAPLAFVFEREPQPPPLDVYRTPSAPRSPPVHA